jgi:hypothetical protein
MKYFGINFADKSVRLLDASYLPMARTYWGPGLLPEGAEIIGGYQDGHRAGALIRLANGNCVCGYGGVITNIPSERSSHVIR